MGFLEQVRTSCGPQSLSKHRMPDLGVCGSSGASQNTPQLPPGEHRTVGGSKRTPRHTSPRGLGLTWLTTGPPRVGGVGSTLWVFWNQSALRADLRVFQRVGCRVLGCVVRCLGGLKNTPQPAPGEHRSVGGSNWTPGHTGTRRVGLTWLTTGPAGVGGGARRYGFFGTSPHFVRTSESFKE